MEFLSLNQSTLKGVILSQFPDMDRGKISEQIKEYLLPKLKIFQGAGKGTIYYSVEDEYIETEWKDMVSLHYVNTSYQLRNTVIRCHVFSCKEMEAKYYLGFFTLRPIDEIKVMISFIYPNWNNIRFNKNYDVYTMTYRKTVHIQGIEFKINTYPIFCQDSVVTSCAQASIISMSKYLRSVCGIAQLRLAEINNSYAFERKKIYPTEGLGIRQMLEIFFKNKWNITCDNIPARHEGAKENKYKQIKENIDANIESALPVFISVTYNKERTTQGRIAINHILQIIGHTTEDEKRYVILDESGVLTKEFTGARNTCIFLSWDSIVNKLFCNGGYAIYPQYEKVYMMCREIKDRLNPILVNNNDEERIRSAYQNLNFSAEDSRYLLVDNVIVKSFLKENALNLGLIKPILERNLPHYLWYCESEIGGKYLVFFG